MPDAAIAQESLPPVQYLIMETLAARTRCLNLANREENADG